jgi:hypothetical protein
MTRNTKEALLLIAGISALTTMRMAMDQSFWLTAVFLCLTVAAAAGATHD